MISLSLSESCVLAGLKRLGLGLTDQQVHRLSLTLDEDNSGEISVDEFVDGLEKAVAARKARAEQLRRRLGGGSDGGRTTDYPRPWTERPADMTPMQLLQRAAKKAAMGRMIAPISGSSGNKDDVVKALTYCCLKEEADKKRLEMALTAINASQKQAEHEADGGGDDAAPPRRYVLLLTADVKLKYRAVYWLQHPDAASKKRGEDQVRGLRIAGSGPPRLRADVIDRCLNYDSATKTFSPTLTDDRLSDLGHDYVVTLGSSLEGEKPCDAITLRRKKVEAVSRLDTTRDPTNSLFGGSNGSGVGSSSVSGHFGAGSGSTAVHTVGIGRGPLPSASVVYTGGQVGYSRSCEDVAGRVDTTMSVLRALHTAKQAEERARRLGLEPVATAMTEDYDAENRSGVLKLTKVEKDQRTEKAVSHAIGQVVSFERQLYGKQCVGFQN